MDKNIKIKKKELRNENNINYFHILLLTFHVLIVIIHIQSSVSLKQILEKKCISIELSKK